MYISCPDCSTSFSIDGILIGEHGRAVKCFKCSHTWHQNPTFDEPAPLYEAPRYVPQQSAPPPPPPPPPPAPVFAPLPAPEPEPDMAPLPVPEPEPEPEEIAPPPEPEPEDEDEDAPSDEELDAMLGPEEDIEELDSFTPDAKEDISEMDEDDLAALEDPEPIDSVRPENDEEIDDQEEIEPDDIPDPEPLPDGFADEDDDFNYDDEEIGGSRGALKAMAISLVVIVAIASALIFPRKMIVDLMPLTNDYLYDFVGLHVMLPGEGLKIESEKPVSENIKGVDVVVIRGEITNIFDEARDVPEIHIIAYDSNGKVVHLEKLSPAKNRLLVGEKIKFTAAIKENLILSARKVDVTFGKMESNAPPAAKK